MNWRWLFSALILASVLPAAPPARADESEVRFCFNEWPPYVDIKDSKPVGVSVDVMREAARRAGMHAVFSEFPWNRCLELVRSGEYDAVLDAMDRPEFLQGPTSYSVYSNTFWVREDENMERLDFEALRGKTIGLIDGYTYPENLWRDLKSAEVTIDHAVDDGTNIRKLAFGRVDAIVADYASTVLFVRSNGLKLKAILPTHSADRLYPSFNGKRVVMQKAIDDAIRQMIADGYVDNVYREYLGMEFSDPGLP